MSQELVKGYGRKGLSPRCMIKLDMQKTYDSVDWSFLEQVLIGMNFPTSFIRWIMTCVTTVLYSILINGTPSAHFPKKERPKSRRPIIPLSVYHCNGLFEQKLEEFSSVSGLIANKDKSSIYFRGVPNEDQRRILDFLGIPKGELQIKYLGVPLCAKRISVVQYQPLLEKMLGRITSWTTKFLSYAGRMQFLKSVLFSIQVFWSQLFVLPRKVIKMIEAICRTFLWTEGIDVSKKALLA
ncbi:uncharacterized protein LOC132043204 [Lycium ferocissimum]|uniref:uncharacterized protein LOC132043204 n=1 Tax=Lycium ferocissimum TaxID=112874 RepID=UPI002814A13A|nr:uncharacterized protein LOC132043204 [Lycium ferocissimum]